MFPGFEKIVEDKIKRARKRGAFKNLPGSGKPLSLDKAIVPEDCRMAYKILKNADFVPPEVEMLKEIRQTETLLAGMKDTAEKYKTLKKLNFMILKLNTLRNTSMRFELPQRYEKKMCDRFEEGKTDE